MLCHSCIYYNKKTDKCQGVYTPSKIDNSCKNYLPRDSTQSILWCDLCGSPYAHPANFVDGHSICPNCLRALDTCSTCRNSYCAFGDMNNHPKLPQTIQQKTAQGPVVMIQEVPNPVRIEKTCHSCTCYNSTTASCARKNNACEAYEIGFSRV